MPFAGGGTAVLPSHCAFGLEARVELMSLSEYNGSVKSRLLAIKIGNSNVAVGVFEGSTLLAHWRAHTVLQQTADEYGLLLDDFIEQARLSSEPWRGAIIVSVVPPLTATFEELCRRHYRVDPLIAGPKLKTGMPVRYQDMRTLGADRMVAAVAAKAHYGAPAIVIDFGTATTFNVVNRAGEFAGGAIAPGMNLGADALYRSTAQLPRIDLAPPPQVIATDTVHALQSGILYGYVGLVEGMIRRIREEMGEPGAPVIATGGYASLVVPRTQSIDHFDPDLILRGLLLLYEMNTRQGVETATD